MDHQDELTPADTIQITSDAREGKARREDVLRLFALAREGWKQGKPLPAQLADYFSRALEDISTGRRTPEAALGLTRKKGRPPADEETAMSMAAEMLCHKLKGLSHQSALAETSDRFGWGITAIGKTWRRHKLDAITYVRLQNDRKYTGEEFQRLRKIFRREAWFQDGAQRPIGAPLSRGAASCVSRRKKLL